MLADNLFGISHLALKFRFSFFGNLSAADFFRLRTSRSKGFIY